MPTQLMGNSMGGIARPFLVARRLWVCCLPFTCYPPVFRRFCQSGPIRSYIARSSLRSYAGIDPHNGPTREPYFLYTVWCRYLFYHLFPPSSLKSISSTLYRLCSRVSIPSCQISFVPKKKACFWGPSRRRGIYESHPIFSQVQLNIMMDINSKHPGLFPNPRPVGLAPRLLYGKMFNFHLQENTFTHATYNDKIVLKTKLWIQQRCCKSLSHGSGWQKVEKRNFKFDLQEA